MRIVFMGTPEFALPSLEALLLAGHDVVGVFCQPDKPKGRGKKLLPCPVKEYALEKGIPVFQPQKIRVDGLETLKALQPDLCVTAAFGQILSQENLDVPKFGTVNVHSSLLPKYRGSAPINWAIICGESVTGVTTMMTDKGMDSGDILLQERYEINADESAAGLTIALSHVGAKLLIKTLDLLEKGTCPRTPQEHAQMTYQPMLKKQMGQMDFSLSGNSVVNLVRGVNPWPGAYTYLGGEVLKVWRAKVIPVPEGMEEKAPYDILVANRKEGIIVKAGKDAVLLQEIQLPGKKRMDACAYLTGHEIKETRLEWREEKNG